MKKIVKYSILAISVTGTSLIALAQNSSPPGMPSNPVGVVPWNSELLTGAGILLFGVYGLIRNKIKK